MVLTKEELIQSLQNEVRILLHLIGKIEPKILDYRPSAKQRSTIELLRYLSYMGPTLISGIRAGGFDPAVWTACEENARSADFETVLATITGQSEKYAEQLSDFSDEELRGEIEMFGKQESRGSLMVNIILASHAAYRTQLFLYLKANGREELNTYNLWAGIDGTM